MTPALQRTRATWQMKNLPVGPKPVTFLATPCIQRTVRRCILEDWIGQHVLNRNRSAAMNVQVSLAVLSDPLAAVVALAKANYCSCDPAGHHVL